MHQDNATTHYGTAKTVLDEIGVTEPIIYFVYLFQIKNIFFYKR
jgi:hypothetical protein